MGNVTWNQPASHICSPLEKGICHWPTPSGAAYPFILHQTAKRWWFLPLNARSMWAFVTPLPCTIKMASSIYLSPSLKALKPSVLGCMSHVSFKVCFLFNLWVVSSLVLNVMIWISTFILVGAFNPSEKYESQLGLLFQTEWKNKKCSKPPTSTVFVWTHVPRSSLFDATVLHSNYGILHPYPPVKLT